MNDEQVNVMHRRMKHLQQEVAELTSRVKLGEERYHRICDRLLITKNSEPTVIITAEQFDEAAAKSRCLYGTVFFGKEDDVHAYVRISDLKKNLGLHEK